MFDIAKEIRLPWNEFTVVKLTALEALEGARLIEIMPRAPWGLAFEPSEK